MENRGDITNEQRERLKVLLPEKKTRRGRPAQGHRQIKRATSIGRSTLLTQPLCMPINMLPEQKSTAEAKTLGWPRI